MPRTARLIATLVLGVLTFLGRVATHLWVTPLMWRFESPAPFIAVSVLELVAIPVLPVIIFVKLVAPLRCRPSAFDVAGTPARFTAPGFPHGPGLGFIFAGWIFGGTVQLQRVPGVDQQQFDTSMFGIVFGTLAVASLIVFAMVFLIRSLTVTMSLTPSSLTIRGFRREMVVPWDELIPGGPPPPTRLSTGNISLYLREWQPEKRRYRSENLPVGRLDVDPTFLTGAIRHYVEHPEHRAGIGTPEELTRLCGVLATGPTPLRPAPGR